MAFEQLKAEIAMLVRQMDDEPEDVHELHARIRQKLAELRAMGQPLPDDLTALERRLDSMERAPVRDRVSSAGQQPPAPARRKTASRSRPAAAKKKASPPKKAKRPAARKSAAASRRTAAKRGRKGAAKAKRSTARKAKRSGRGRR